ncbi:MAG: 6-phosphogluconolactonase [Anaerolineae bacterium]
MHAERHIYPNTETLAEAVAQHLVTLCQRTHSERRPCTLALAGGSTPRPAYEQLARPRFSERIDWSRTHVFWGDERCVPPNDARSNYRMARETLLDHVPIPAENVHRLRGELPPEEAAAQYEDELQAVFGDVRLPSFDLILLGLGEDGHTASLFPDTEALDVCDRRIVANYVPHLEAWRLTLTLPVINAAANVVFIVSGVRKRSILQRVLAPEPETPPLPAQRVHPRDGRLIWLMDKGAAG